MIKIRCFIYSILSAALFILVAMSFYTPWAVRTWKMTEEVSSPLVTSHYGLLTEIRFTQSFSERITLVHKDFNLVYSGMVALCCLLAYSITALLCLLTLIVHDYSESAASSSAFVVLANLDAALGIVMPAAAVTVWSIWGYQSLAHPIALSNSFTLVCLATALGLLRVLCYQSFRTVLTETTPVHTKPRRRSVL